MLCVATIRILLTREGSFCERDNLVSFGSLTLDKRTAHDRTDHLPSRVAFLKNDMVIGVMDLRGEQTKSDFRYLSG